MSSMFDRIADPVQPKKGSATPKKPNKPAEPTTKIVTTASGLPVMVRKIGKSADKDNYGTLLTYIPHDVKRKAIRKWQDENPKQSDASDMVEHLLREYLAR